MSVAPALKRVFPDLTATPGNDGPVSTLRSRRLESIFGTLLMSLQESHIQALVTAGVQEAYDLDFKLALYIGGDSAKRSLAGDVAALANTGGGMILIGIQEDEHARAISAPGVVLSDSESARMRQVVASLSAPMPDFDIVSIPSLHDQSHGYYAILVPRSPSSPHAVLVNDGLRYPRRNGSTTRYLSEPEVAAAYRERQLGAERQGERLEQIEADSLGLLKRGGDAWLMISLAPGLPGSAELGQRELMQFDAAMRPQDAWMIAPGGVSFRHTRVGRRRFVAHGGAHAATADWVLAEYYADGAGTYSLRLPDLAAAQPFFTPQTDPEATQLISDQRVVMGIVTGLHRLAKHARDVCAAGGSAIVRARLLAGSDSTSLELGHERPHFPDSRSRMSVVGQVAPCEAVSSLDDLATIGPPLLATTAQLANEIGQTFGIAELGQVTRDGKLQRRYWNNAATNGLHVAWAEEFGIEILNTGATDL